MKKIRLIARLDVKGSNLVKGIQYEGLRKLGDPHDFAYKYYQQGIDELLYLDTVASLYERNNLAGILSHTASDVFIPITAGGGLRRLEDVQAVLNAGADKVAVNTAALRRPEFIREIAQAFGSQCVVLSVQAKRRDAKDASLGWEAYYDNGREHSGKDVLEWVKQAQMLGAGEILVTSVDCEGFRKGMDLSLIEQVCAISDVPVIAAGGAASVEDIVQAAKIGTDAVAVGSILHYEQQSVMEIKQQLEQNGIEVRKWTNG